MRVRRRRRISGGRLQAWSAAFDYLAVAWRVLVKLAVGIACLAVFANLPFVPGTGYSRGLTTGVLLVGLLWSMSWNVWVTSGHAYRIQGALTEDVVGEDLRKSKHVYDVVDSLKFDRMDVDHVVLSAAGVAAVETKWHAHRPSPRRLGDDAYQAAVGARRLRHTLPHVATDGTPTDLVTAALIICGPGRRGVRSRTIRTNLGPVEVINLGDLQSWLLRRGTGPLGRRPARDLAKRLHQLAYQRDAAAVSAGPVLRWLARVR